MPWPASWLHDNHPVEAAALVEKLLPHADGPNLQDTGEMPQLLMDRADAAAAVPARRAESVGFYAEVADKYPKTRSRLRPCIWRATAH